MWGAAGLLKLTDFNTEVLFDLVDSLYRLKHGLTVAGNHSMRDLIEHECMQPATISFPPALASERMLTTAETLGKGE